MKRKDIKELHTKTIKELNGLLSKAQEGLVHLRMEQEKKKSKNHRRFLEKRREIARIKTIIREKELSA